MAIGDSSSGQGHEEWASARYYQRSTTPSAGSGGGLVFARDNPVTESTVVTTTATTSAASSAPGGGGAQPVSEGRVGKARRRSRASRKAPTTILNTDTANFRAMVQQFTGVPAAPFQGGGYPQVAVDVGAGGGPATLSFGLHGGGAGQQLYQRQAGFPFGPPPPQFQQHHERPALFTLGGAGGATGGATGGVFLRPGRGGNPERAGMDASTEGLMLESIPPSQMMSRPAASSSGSSTTNRFLL